MHNYKAALSIRREKGESNETAAKKLRGFFLLISFLYGLHPVVGSDTQKCIV
jgi:hypothetical protein